MQRVTEGLYVDSAGALHFDVDEILNSLKWPKTPDTVETLHKAINDVMEKRFPLALITAVDHSLYSEATNGGDRR